MGEAFMVDCCSVGPDQAVIVEEFRNTTGETPMVRTEHSLYRAHKDIFLFLSKCCQRIRK
jgi:hypothetical protein